MDYYGIAFTEAVEKEAGRQRAASARLIPA